jgi:hypothetical protein
MLDNAIPSLPVLASGRVDKAALRRGPEQDLPSAAAG